MIPVAAVFIVSHDHQHVLPLRTFLQFADQLRDVIVALFDRRISRMLIETALRFVEGHLRQGSRSQIVEQIFIVFQMLLALGSMNYRVQIGVVIEGLMMHLKIRRCTRTCRGELPIADGDGERRVPCTGVPAPGDAFGSQ